MFGRRTTPFGGAPNPPSPPSNDDWPPFKKMDAALDAAIRLFSRALEQAAQDIGGLSIPGEAPPSVSSLLADCIVYPGRNGPEFLTLGITRDFKGFTYQPHCRLFLILNAALILEDLQLGPLRSDIAISQVPRPLIDAHMMKKWIRLIRPTGDATANGDMDRLSAIAQQLPANMMEIGRLAPRWISERISIEECAHEWSTGFPGTIGRPLAPDVKRINNLPMTDFVEKLITDFLVETQMQGLNERRRA